MKTYTALIQVNAKPCTSLEATEKFGYGIVGTHKLAPALDGYLIRQCNGWHTWMPAEAFSAAYTLVDTPLDKLRAELNELEDRRQRLGAYLASSDSDVLPPHCRDLMEEKRYLLELLERIVAAQIKAYVPVKHT